MISTKKNILRQPNSKIDIASLVSAATLDLTGVALKDDTRILVNFMEYFGNVTKILDRAKRETLLNYLVFRSACF